MIVSRRLDGQGGAMIEPGGQGIYGAGGEKNGALFAAFFDDAGPALLQVEVWQAEVGDATSPAAGGGDEFEQRQVPEIVASGGENGMGVRISDTLSLSLWQLRKGKVYGRVCVDYFL